MPRGKQVKHRVSPRMQMILDGTLKIEDLDDEEIFRGRLRAVDGTFAGRGTDMIPRQFYDAATRELMKRWQQRVNEQLEPMLKVLQELATNPRVSADARYKSAVYLVERAAGKVPDKIEATVEVGKWEAAIEDLVYDDDKPKKKKKTKKKDAA